MRTPAAIVFLLVPAVLACGPTSGATLGVSTPKNTRRLTVVRTYEVPVVRGEKSVAAVPAMMSFWGATHQQVVLQSAFKYGLKPDRIEVTADNLGMPRRYYELTWDAPQADTITVTQQLTVELTCLTVLQTAARLPYPKGVLDRLASSLGADEKIKPDNPKIGAIARDIAKRAPFAEEAIELACDWVSDNIPFQSGANGDSDTILATGKGNCTGMSNIACAILRKMGVPAEPVDATFVGDGTRGHGFIEAYLPDAGWVFYDLSNANRGFKSLDCLMTAGYAFRTANPKSGQWHDGHFCVSKDAAPYKNAEEVMLPSAALRPGPKGAKVAGVRIIRQKTPDAVRARHQPLSALILDLSVPPGQRDYVKESPAPAPAAVPKAPPKTGPAADGDGAATSP